MAEYVVNGGNQEILCKYQVPLSSAMFAKQLASLVEPGLCRLPVIGFYNKSPVQYSGLGRGVVRLGPMELYQQGEDPVTGRAMLFRVTTSESVDVECFSNTVAIGYEYLYDPTDVNASVTYGTFRALSSSEMGGFSGGVLVCLVETVLGGSGVEVVRADSRFVWLSNNLLRSAGFLNEVNLSPALPGFGVGSLYSTVVLRKGNVLASHEESIFDGAAGLVKRRAVAGWHGFAGRSAGVYVLGCVAYSTVAVGDGPLPLVCSGGGVEWFSPVVGGDEDGALESALQKVPFGVVIFGAVYWDGSSLLTSKFFNVKRTFADMIKQVEFLQSAVDVHEAGRGTDGTADTAVFSHVALDRDALNGLAISGGLISMALASDDSPGTVVVPGGNGLSVNEDGEVSLALAEFSGNKNQPGAVKVQAGNGLSLSSGVVSMGAASTSAKGAVQVTAGNGLSVSSGVVSMGAASATVAGAMSSDDKTKLDGIASGAQVNPGSATTVAAGLMSSADKTKLDGLKGVPSPVAGDANKFLKATGEGVFGWWYAHLFAENKTLAESASVNNPGVLVFFPKDSV